jgi:DinB family protein
MDSDTSLREHLVKLLEGGQAHVTFDAAVKGVPVALRGKRPKGSEHSLWEILEHMRIAQWDILEFSRDAKHVSPPWPGGYWPKTKAPPDAQAWNKCIRTFNADLDAMRKLVAATTTDLHAPLAHGDGQTILREALLVADHNAYHLGEFVLVRRLLSAWK